MGNGHVVAATSSRSWMISQSLITPAKDLTCDTSTLADVKAFLVVNDFVEAVVLLVLPLILGLLVGIRLGAAKSRMDKSVYQVTTSWVASVISMFMFRLSKTSPTCHMTDGMKLRKNYSDTHRESGFDLSLIPKHVAVIMDGNRRYGKRMYGKGSAGHFDGAMKALQFIEWCSTEGLEYLTLYAFSTENWQRESAEVNILMDLFLKFVKNDLRPVVFNRKVRVSLLCTDKENIPQELYEAIQSLCEETSKHPRDSLSLLVCLSYGSRGEILLACRSLCQQCLDGKLKIEQMTEESISQNLLTKGHPDPDILIRTSGEERVSNFLLWQIAYSECFFLQKDWPELEKTDFLSVICAFAQNRQRRFGK